MSKSFFTDAGGSSLCHLRCVGTDVLCCLSCDHELFFLFVYYGQVHLQFMWMDSLDVRFFVVQFYESCSNGHQSVSLRTTSGVSWPVCPLRALTHVHVHFHVQFMLNFRRRYCNTICFHPVAPCVCHFLFNTSSSPPTFRLHLAHTLCHATPRSLLFRMIIVAFLFPQSFRDGLLHTQSCVSSGVLPSPTP